GGLYPISYFARRFFHQRKTPPLDVEHVLKPRFDPTADGDVTTDLRLFWLCLRNQRRKSAAVAAAKNVHAVRVDEVVVFQCAERSAVPSKLRFEIGLRTIAFAIAAARLINLEQAKPRRLREPAQNQSDRIFRVSRCFNRVATQPTGKKHDWQFPFRGTRLGDD